MYEKNRFEGRNQSERKLVYFGLRGVIREGKIYGLLTLIRPSVLGVWGLTYMG